MTSVPVQIRVADITRLPVDMIVNAANAALVPGGGVDGAINRAAGPALGEAMLALGGCPTGEVRVTPAFNLPCQWVAHAVGPIYSAYPPTEAARLLAACYQNGLSAALAHGCRSIAFPAISTGVYGYPPAAAADVALDAIQAWFAAQPAPPDLAVTLVAFSPAAASLLESALLRRLSHSRS